MRQNRQIAQLIFCSNKIEHCKTRFKPQKERALKKDLFLFSKSAARYFVDITFLIMILSAKILNY
jgi:hypothetical protein